MKCFLCATSSVSDVGWVLAPTLIACHRELVAAAV